MWIMDQYTGRAQSSFHPSAWRAALANGTQRGRALTPLCKEEMNPTSHTRLRANGFEKLDEGDNRVHQSTACRKQAKDAGMFSSAGSLPSDKILNLVLTTARGVGFDFPGPMATYSTCC
jgi:hypothetical protein